MVSNQAVVFTKPLHHLGTTLTPEDMDERVQTDFPKAGFTIIKRVERSGEELARRDVIRKHYQMYSRASYGDFSITEQGRSRFEEAFGRNWYEEVEAGRISGNPELMDAKEIGPHKLFDFWNARFTAGRTMKVQDGVIMAWIEELDAFCINAFYPAMEANFYHPLTRIFYYVMEFDPSRVSWLDFRKKVLGSTNAASADPASFRGRLYAEFPVSYPGRDNFVHGSAGPFEAMVERMIHEADFELPQHPVGCFLAERGLNRKALERWVGEQSISALGRLFDDTEEKDTDEVLLSLDSVSFS